MKILEWLGLSLILAGLFFALRPAEEKTNPSPLPLAQTTPIAVAKPSVEFYVQPSAAVPEEPVPAGRERLVFAPYTPDFDAWVQETRDQYDDFLDSLEERFARPTRKVITISFFMTKESHFPTWGQGFFDGSVKVSRNFLQKSPDQAQILLRHEIVHAYLGAGWPTWLDEGLAEYLSCEGRRCEKFKFPPVPGLFSKKEELHKNFSALSRNEAKRAYLHSGFFVRTLFAKYGSLFWKDLALRAQGNPERKVFLMCSCTFDQLWEEVNLAWKERRFTQP